MKPETQTSWVVKAALWTIAISLVTIACCLVLLVIHTTGDADQKAEVTSVDENADSRIHESKLERDREFVTAERSSVSASYARSSQSNSAAGEAVSRDPAPVEKPANVILAVNSRPLPAGPALIYSSQYQGVISGTVRLLGEPPAERTIDVGDVPCADAEQKPRQTRFFVTDTNAGLADTLVFISDGLNSPVFPVVRETAELLFTNCQIEPYVSAAMVKQRLIARDATGLTHAFRFWSEDPKAPQFQNALAPNGTIAIPNNQSGLFGRVSCDAHPWELAYVSFFRQPYFAVTDEHGQFSITNVPPGSYTLEARHRAGSGAFARVTKPVRLLRSDSVTVDFQLNAIR
jgi:hypothetical protein